MNKRTTYFSLVLIATLLFQLVVIPIHKVLAHKDAVVENNSDVSLTINASHDHSDCFICDNDHYLPSLIGEIVTINSSLFHYIDFHFLWFDHLIAQSNHYHYKLRGPPFLFLL